MNNEFKTKGIVCLVLGFIMIMSPIIFKIFLPNNENKWIGTALSFLGIAIWLCLVIDSCIKSYKKSEVNYLNLIEATGFRIKKYYPDYCKIGLFKGKDKKGNNTSTKYSDLRRKLLTDYNKYVEDEDDDESGNDEDKKESNDLSNNKNKSTKKKSLTIDMKYSLTQTKRMASEELFIFTSVALPLELGIVTVFAEAEEFPWPMKLLGVVACTITLTLIFINEITRDNRIISFVKDVANILKIPLDNND